MRCVLFAANLARGPSGDGDFKLEVETAESPGETALEVTPQGANFGFRGQKVVSPMREILSPAENVHFPSRNPRDSHPIRGTQNAPKPLNPPLEVDSIDKQRLGDSKNELSLMLEEEELKGVALFGFHSELAVGGPFCRRQSCGKMCDFGFVKMDISTKRVRENPVDGAPHTATSVHTPSG